MGITGELKVNTVEIVATPEEAPEETTELPEEEQEAVPAEEAPVQKLQQRIHLRKVLRQMRTHSRLRM